MIATGFFQFLQNSIYELAISKMKFNSLLLNSLTILAFSLLGFGVGKLIGNFFLGESDPVWTYYTLPPSHQKILNIVYYQTSSTSDYLPGDSLFVKTENDEFYSYTLFEDKWMFVDADPTRWDNPYVSKCATQWNGYSDFSQLRAYPPVKRNVLDSMGENSWLYPSTSIAKCYILLDDGSLQAWIYSGNAKDLLKNRFLKKEFIIIGTSIGLVFSIFIILYKRRTAEFAMFKKPVNK